MSDVFARIDAVSRRFTPRLSVGDRIAAAFGAPVDTRTVHALDGVSLAIRKGEVLGLVGESGCGKSTLGRVLTGILPPSEGEVTVAGEPVMSAGPNPVKLTRRVQMVFQNPYASLNPRMRVGEAVAEGPLAHGLTTGAEAGDYVASWLARVGLDPAFASRYPHQFSGGQRQRIAIARALAMQPDMLVCDEPVASLDVSIQAQIVNLFLQLRRELGLTMLFISHDLGVVRHLCDRVAVMYLGRIVEVADVADLYAQPLHPYARALLDSVPQLRLDDDALVTFRAVAGELPSPLAPPPGCHFSPRCPMVEPICRTLRPALDTLLPGHAVACHVAQAEAVAGSFPAS
jgi:peptide/nickel transport system ATP-binding protein